MGSVILHLDEIAAGFSEEQIVALSLDYMRQDSDEQKVTGILLAAYRDYQSGHVDAALLTLLKCRFIFGYMPLTAMANIIWLANTPQRRQIAAEQCLSFAMDAAKWTYYDLACEASQAALILDAEARFDIIRCPQQLEFISRIYLAAATTLPQIHVPAPSVDDGRVHVAVIVPNLVDDVVAYTKRVLQLARFSPKNIALHIYVSESLSARKNPQFPYGCIEGTTEISGQKTLQALRNAGIPVTVMPRNMTVTKTAVALAEAIRADGCHRILLQSGMACPIDWLAVRLIRGPLKTGIHIGTSYFGAGLDIMFVDNPINITRETNWDEAIQGKRICLPKGVDTEHCAEAKPLHRADFGIPEDAIVLGTLSNHLEKRLSEAYIKLIIRVMKKHANVWFAPFGRGACARIKEQFANESLSNRFVPCGTSTDVPSALKMLDIFVNEFPVGGSQSVLEAMACGIPVVAMHWGDAHAECAGANMLGAPYGITSRDLAAYQNRLEEWILDESLRRQAGEHLRKRAAQQFDVATYVSALCSMR
ncbi:MAG: glycosyltransferase [Spartobacteria bacterium]|nr:glycosyltransferase [Spartobacteria bacterium]